MKIPSIARTVVVYNCRPCRQSHPMETRATDCRPCRQSHPMGARSTAVVQDHRHYRPFHLVESRATAVVQDHRHYRPFHLVESRATAVVHAMAMRTRSQTRMVLPRTTSETVARSRLTDQAKVAWATMVDQDHRHHHCHPYPKAKGAAPRVEKVEGRPYRQSQGTTSLQSAI